MMMNPVKEEVIRTKLTGTIEGKDVTITYENVVGDLPVNVNAICSVPDATNPMMNTNINVNVSIMGNKEILVSGVVVTGDIDALLLGIEGAIQAVLTTPVV